MINVCIQGKILRSKITDQVQLEGILIPNPHLHAGRGYLEGAGKSNFLSEKGKKNSFWIPFIFKKRKKECILLNSFFVSFRKWEKKLIILNSFYAIFRSGERSAFFWTPFMLSSVKGKRNPFWIPFVLSSDRWKRNVWFTSEGKRNA